MGEPCTLGISLVLHDALLEEVEKLPFAEDSVREEKLAHVALHIPHPGHRNRRRKRSRPTRFSCLPKTIIQVLRAMVR